MANNSEGIMARYKKYLTNQQKKKLRSLYAGYQQTTADERREAYLQARKAADRSAAAASAMGLGGGYEARKQAAADAEIDKYGLQLNRQADAAFESNAVVPMANQTIKAQNEAARKAYERKKKAARRAYQDALNKQAQQQTARLTKQERDRLKYYRYGQQYMDDALMPDNAAYQSAPKTTPKTNPRNNTHNRDKAYQYAQEWVDEAGATRPKTKRERDRAKANRYAQDWAGNAPKESPLKKNNGSAVNPKFDISPKQPVVLPPEYAKEVEARVKDIAPNDVPQVKLDYLNEINQYANLLQGLNEAYKPVGKMQDLANQYQQLVRDIGDPTLSVAQRKQASVMAQQLEQEYREAYNSFNANKTGLQYLQNRVERAYGTLQIDRAVLSRLGVEMTEDDIGFNTGWAKTHGYIPETPEELFIATRDLIDNENETTDEFWKRAKNNSAVLFGYGDESGNYKNALGESTIPEEERKLVLDSQDEAWMRENGFGWVIDGVAQMLENSNQYATFAQAAKAFLEQKEADEWQYFEERNVRRVLNRFNEIDDSEKNTVMSEGAKQTGIELDRWDDIHAAWEGVSNYKFETDEDGQVRAVWKKTGNVLKDNALNRNAGNYVGGNIVAGQIEKKLGLPSRYLNTNTLAIMTKEDAAFINYCYGMGDKETARQYIYQLAELANQLVGKEKADKIAELPWGIRFAREAMDQFSYGISSFHVGLADVFTNHRTPTTVKEVKSSAITENQRERGWGGAADVINPALVSAGNMAPSVALGLAGGAAAGALSNTAAGASTLGVLATEGLSHAGTISMGLSAGGKAKQEALRMGYGKDAANVYGIINGISETCLQEIMGGVITLGQPQWLEALGDSILNSVKNPVARVMVRQALNAASETTEEVMQDILDPVFKGVSLNEKYLNDHPEAKQLLNTALSTVISTLLMNGMGGDILNTAKTETAIQRLSESYGLSVADARFMLNTYGDLMNREGGDLDIEDYSKFNELAAVIESNLPSDVIDKIQKGETDLISYGASRYGAESGKLDKKLTKAERTATQTEAVDHTKALKGKTDEQRRDYLLNAAPTGKVGNAYYTTTDGKAIEFKNLDATQKANYVLAQKCAKAFEGSVDVVIHDTLPLSNGAMVGSDGKLHIALDVTNAQGRESIAYWTLAHEAGHALKIADSKAWNEMFGILTDYAKNHKDRDGKSLYDALVDSITNQYKYDNNSDAFNDEMFSLIAERMVGSEGEQWAATLGDNTIFDAIAKDRNASAKAKRGFIGKMKNAVEKLSRQFRDGGFSKERKRLAKIREQLTEAYKRINEAPSIRDAAVARQIERKAHEESETSQKTAPYIDVPADGVIPIRATSEKVESEAANGDASFSLRYNGEITERSMAYRSKHAEESADVSDDMLEAANDTINNMVKVMMPYLDKKNTQNRHYLPEEILGTTTFKNGSYGRTIENTTICFRTLAYIEFTNEIKKRIGRPLTVEESFLASQMLYDIAKEPQCLYCYVSLDRKAYDGFLLEYMKQRDSVAKEFNALSEEEQKGVLDAISKAAPTSKAAEKVYKDIPLFNTFLDGRKNTAPMRARFGMWVNAFASGQKLITAEDLTTQEKRASITERGLVEQIHDAEAYAQAASWAKKLEEYRAYNGDILNMTAATVKKLNKSYGLRFYSFSEYTPAFIVENMQQIRDASLKGLYGLAYTKKVDFAKIFAKTGMNINVSTFGHWKVDSKGNKVLDADGNPIMVMDTLQGADWEEVKALREEFANVGAVFVATDDDAARWAKSQDWIDVVIPFHIVRTGANVAEFYKWVVHNSEQADLDEKGRKKDIDPPEHHNDYKTYLNLCAKRGLTPRFKSFLDAKLQAKVVAGEQLSAAEDLEMRQYMKFVNETRISTNDSEKLRPVFDENEAKRSFDEFVKEGGYYGDWYKAKNEQSGVKQYDYNEAVDQVVSDIEQGRRANEVDYGRQDIDVGDLSEAVKNRRNLPRTHGQSLATAPTRHSLRAIDTPAFKEWFGKSKVINDDGTPKVVYHQTAKDFWTFNTDNPVAGQYDSETPNGIFFKDNDHDIGIGGSRQMAVYLSMQNPLHFKNREEANRWYQKNIDGYAELQDEMNTKLKPIDDELQRIENEMFAEDTTGEQYAELDKEWNEKLEEMRSAENDYRGRLRELLNEFFIKNDSGYDGIILDYDGHRYVDGKRENVKSYIAFKNTQVKSATDNIGTFDKNNPDIRYQNRATDTEYLSLAEKYRDGTATEEEKAELEKRVEEAAKKAGYTIKAYHGTPLQMISAAKGKVIGEDYQRLETDYADKLFPFVVFKSKSGAHTGIYTATNREAAEQFSYNFGNGGTIYDLFVKADRPLTVDANGNGWANLPATELQKIGFSKTGKIKIDDVVAFAQANNYDSVVVKNVREGGTGNDTDILTDDIVVFNPSQVKSADPLVYDNNGDIIPLSERFNAGNEDIRYQQRAEAPVSQEISSAGTSIKQIPALFKHPNVEFGETNIDIGGGRFDLATNYLAERGTKNMLFDPYNQSEEVNRATLDYLMQGNKADTVTCANVLNVIAEPDARANVILEAAKAIKEDGKAYFMVYEGDGSGEGKRTSAGWQNNRKTADYMGEIGQYFNSVQRKGKLIIASDVDEDLPAASWETTPGNATRYQQRDFRIDFNVPQLDTKALHEAVKGGEGTVENRFEVKYEKTDSGFAVHITDKDSGKTYDRAETVTEGNAKAEAERAAAAVIRNIKRGRPDSTSKSTAGIYIEKGEIPARDVNIPVSVKEGMRTSKLARTIAEAPDMTDESVDELMNKVYRGFMSYKPDVNQESMDKALKKIEDNMAEAVVEWNQVANSGRILTPDDVALGSALMVSASQSGDINSAMEIASQLQDLATTGGKLVQSFRMIKRLGAAGAFYYVNRQVAKINAELEKQAKGYKLTLNEELVRNLLNARDYHDIREATEALRKDLGQQLKPTLRDWLTAWRYTAMLGNAKTLVRNDIGNAAYVPVIMMDNVLNAIGQTVASAVSKGKFEKTTKLFAGKEYRNFANWDWKDTVKYDIKGNKYSEGQLGDIKDYMRYDTHAKGILKPGAWVFEKWRSGTQKFMEDEALMGDMAFKKLHYQHALATRLDQLKVDVKALQDVLTRSRNNETFERGTREAKLLAVYEAAAQYAVSEANRNTYNDINAFASFVSQMSRTMYDKEVGGKHPLRPLHYALEGVLPFKNTPANIVARAAEHSPIGLAKTLTLDIGRVAKGKISGEQFIHNLSSGLTGSALFALGAILAKAGILHGGLGYDDKDDKEKKRRGHQSYSLEIGNTSITLDWLAPECIPLFMGVELFEQLGGMSAEDWSEKGLKALLNVTTGAFEPMLNMSMLSGINALFEGFTSTDDLQGIEKVAATVATSYLTQFQPTILGQFARTIDPTRRTTYYDKNAKIPPFMQKFWQTALKKIPGATFLLQPYVDEFGNTSKTFEKYGSGAFWLNMAEQFFSPAYRSKLSNTEVDQEIERLGEDVYPSRANKYINFDKQKYNLSADEYTAYATLRGETAYALVQNMIGTDAYNALSDAEKVAAFKDAYTYADTIAKSTILGMRGVIGADAGVLESWVGKANEYAKAVGTPDAISQFIAIKQGLKVNGITNRDDRAQFLWQQDIPAENKALLMEMNDGSNGGYAEGTAFYNKKGELIVDFGGERPAIDTAPTAESEAATEAPSSAEVPAVEDKYVEATNTVKKMNAEESTAYLNTTSFTSEEKYQILAKADKNDPRAKNAEAFHATYGLSYDDMWDVHTKYNSETFHGYDFQKYVDGKKGLKGRQKFALVELANTQSAWLEKAQSINSKMGISYDTLWKIKLYWSGESGQGKKARITAYCKSLGLKQSQIDKLYNEYKFLS